MLFKTGIRRVTGLLLSTALIFGNIAPSMTAYAVDAQRPVNPDGTTPNGNKPQDTINTEGTYINDTPARLQVSKVKTEVGGHEGIAPDKTDAPQKNTVTYKISGRVEGAAADLLRDYGADHIELAYSSNNAYLGYGWLNGTLEYLMNRKAQGLNETMQIMYNAQGVFEGYAYVTRTLETADDANRYVAGAEMALYDAVEIFRNPEVTRDGEYYGEDDRFTGVTVVRDSGSNNVTSVYVNKGHAGNQTMYVLQKEDGSKIEIDSTGKVVDDNYNYQDEINDSGDGVWIAKTIEREDTPILFYSLDNLHVTSNDEYTSIGLTNTSKVDEVYGAERYNKANALYGFDKDGNVVNIDQKDERDFSIYAYEAGSARPVYEFVGGDFNEIRYSLPNKTIRVGKDTVMYHLDEDGNRDAMVDPQTGIAYIEEKIEPQAGHDNIHDVNDTDSTENTKLFVWPVNVFYDGSGASQGNQSGSRTFQKILTTRIATINADTAQEYTTGTLNGASFEKSMNPVLDIYGHPVYYRKSDKTYVKGEDRYDYDGDEYIGYTYKDSLDTENENAYKINDHEKLYNGDDDNPFDQSTHYQYSDKQDVKVIIDMDGNYIVNGKSTVPVPVRENHVFAGWLIEPNRLTAKKTAVARWQNADGSGMDETENAQWYSDRAATGKTETVTVTFDANGGEFKSGSGDIHSTDNLLYRRLGDAYLMENVWTTGENTPNDPFDTQKVDTVENTADGKNTISADGKTGNDVYSDTKSGGQADMLKRVNQGTYIMEERKAPDGYAKGLPVGVTVNESTDVQTAEMTDTTVKAEFIKVDAPNGYEKDLYVNGEQEKNDAGAAVTVKETKGQWYFKHVNGAVLALKAADTKTKKSFSDWVKVTGNKEITKKEENGSWYLEFDTSSPLFLEGIPAGNYTVTEVKTPDGYVTMEPQNLTITGESGVQIFGMTDEHTRLEIEKFYYDGMQNRHMPNTNRAGLSLIDQDGNTVAEWKTDDLSDYTNNTEKKTSTSVWTRIANFFTGKSAKTSFVESFTEQVQNGNTDMTQFSWEVTREAVRSGASTAEKEIWIISDGTRITCLSGNAPDDAPEAFREAYAKRNQEEGNFTYQETMSAEKDEAASRTLSDQVWNVSNGTRMHISIYPLNDGNESGSQAYGVSFGFNYTDGYTGKYANMVTYDTVDGMHRFDYIPEGNYILRETETPSGYVTAADKQVTVENMDAVQRYTLENKEKQLSVAKIGQKDQTYYTGTQNGSALSEEDAQHAAVIPGASMNLYYSETEIADYETAFADGKVPGSAVLAESFETGKDGVYTEAEYKAELIRKDQIGDYRPHTVTDLKNGYYYLVEVSAPAYYETAPVQEIHVTDLSTADALTGIRVVDKPLPVAVKVVKKNKEGSPLAGATFSVKNKTLGGIEVGTMTTDADGNAVLNITDTARFAADGKLDPYIFTITEVSAPAGYTLDPTIHEFTMDTKKADGGSAAIMVNTKDAAIKDGVLTVTDEESQLTVSKADFKDGTAVPGAKLVIYEAVQENGTWKSNGKSMKEDWTWNVKENEKTHAVTGLTAGGTYVLREEEAPAGYTKADDMFFQISADGTGISKTWYDPKEQNMIDFTADNTGAVESVTFTTHSVLGTYVVLEDLTDGTEKNLGTLKTGVLNLSSDNVMDGNRYRASEYVKYTNGATDRLSTTTFNAKLYHDWMQIDLNDAVTGLNVEVMDADGKPVVTYTPDGNGTYTVANPLEADPNELTVARSLTSTNGVNHAAAQPGKQIRYRITYHGAGQDVILVPADGLTYLSTDDLKKDGSGYYKATTEKEDGSYTIVAEIDDNASGYINQKVFIGERSYSYLNVVAVNKGSGLFENTSKLVLTNVVSGTHLENENAEFTYHVTLTGENGEALDGLYDYRTRYSDGVFRAAGKETDFTVTLSGNDFLLINDLPYNTKYAVTRIVAENDPFTVASSNTEGKTSKNAVTNVLFTNTRNETSKRTVFQKNADYTLKENLLFAKAEPMVLNQYEFSFGEKCQVKNVTMLNKKTEVWFTKTDWTDCEELEGATCRITDEDGNVLTDELGNPMEWVSTKEPKKFTGVLEAGKTYRFHEEKAPDGYGYSEDVTFTVSEDGTIDKVVMQDKPTVVSFSKEDFAGAEIPGASCELKELKENGNSEVIDAWVSGTTPHVIEGKLTPKKTYMFHEEGAPDGYTYCLDIAFTLDRDGNVKNAHYINESGETVVYDEDGNPSDIVVRTDESGMETYWNGEAQVTRQGDDIVGNNGEILVKGAKKEIEVADNILKMKDAPFDTTLRKEDFAGKELPGALCVISRVNKDGTTAQIDRWVSEEGKDHEIGEKLSAGATYRYHEEKAPDGYGFSQDIEFTIDRNGHIESAHYVDKDGNKLLYDKEGYQTDIIVKEDGTFEKDGKPVTVNENGDAVDENGTVLAGGVKSDMQIKDNVIIMKDASTDIHFDKVDSTTGKSLAGAVLQVIDKNGTVVSEWTTDETGAFDLKATLIAGESYTLHEKETVDGYYYSYDVTFTVNRDGKPQTVQMRNREIKVVTPPDEYPKVEPPTPETPNPDYTMEKERTTPAPAKEGTKKFGFFKGDRVEYDVTIVNTGSMDLTMDVNDTFEKPELFSTPQVKAVKFYLNGSVRQNMECGSINSMNGSVANITIRTGGYAVVTYEAYVLTDEENLSNSAPDDGLGYLNTATTTNVIGKYYEYSGEDHDGDGKGDEKTEVTVTKEDFPKELEDKKDDANTPVQKPDTPENPSYQMDKTRISPAAPKAETDKFGFHRGDTVTYQVRIVNTGDLPLKMFVTDAYAPSVSKYFTTPVITAIEGENISAAGHGIGTRTARIRIEPGKEAVITYQATVSDTAPERLSWTEADDGRGYLNTARTYNVIAEKPDGTEGGKDEYPQIPDKEDDAHTPVQTPETPDKPGTPDKPDEKPDTPEPDKKVYPIIWLLKDSVDDPEHILPGGTFQVLSEDKSEVLIDNFTMDGTWQEWDVVLKADHTYWLHEVTPPAGYSKAEDVKFTVSHYGEQVEAAMTDKPTDVDIRKVDAVTKKPLAGVLLQIIDRNNQVVKEWTTDAGGEFIVSGELIAGEEYTLHEVETIDGYYYSYDVKFTVNENGDRQTVTMKNRPIVVVNPPDENPPDHVPEGKEPKYEMEKERVTEAPEKTGTDKFGFFKGDIVTYDVTIKNTGSTTLTMDVDDAFEEPERFTTPEVDAVRFYGLTSGRLNSSMGTLNSVNGSKANITLKAGSYAVVTYKATVLTDKENLSNSAPDDGLGYLNTATTTNVIGKYYEYSGEDHDGDGKGDEKTEVTVTKKDYPDELGDKKDDANTPVQKPDKEYPSYSMDKRRAEDAPAKGDTGKFGFKPGTTVSYETRIKNTGIMPLTMYVTDAYAPEISKYFKDLKISEIRGEDLSEYGEGVGYQVAKIRIEPDAEAVVVFQAVITKDAAERLSNAAKDDGLGYLNTARTYGVKAEKPDGTTGDSKEYPGIGDKEDDAHTPVQGDKPEHETPDYPIIWLLKHSVGDPDHILTGGKFQILSEDKSEVLIDTFEMEGIWKEWDAVLKADHTYWLHEVTPPDGYTAAEDVKFTVSHYGESMEVPMNDEGTKVTLTKENFAGQEVPGAYCELKKVGKNGELTTVDAWRSTDVPHVLQEKLVAGETYRFHEENAPKGYNYSEDIEFTVGKDGTVSDAHYVDKNGNTLLYDENGYTTSITVKPDGTLKNGETTVTIDGNGNAVLPDGTVLAKGVQKDIPVTDNAIHMKDAPTKMRFLKVDRNGTAVRGAKLVLRAENGDVIDAWETDGNPHDVEGVLDVGKTYTLEEDTAPTGYYKADPVTFTVTHSPETQVIRMVDEPTEIKVVKTDENGKELSGGKFSIIRKDNGEIAVPEFSLDGSLQFTERLEAGVTYLFHEIEAPSGYQISSDMEFTVPVTKPGNILTVTMVDHKKPGGGGSHGGGGGGKSSTPTVTFHKYDGMTLKALEGAEFTIYDADGKVYKTVKTGQSGYAAVSFGKTGKYTYKETKAPDGYEANETVYELEITSSTNRMENVANYATPRTVTIKKADAETGEGIKGVRFEITDESGKVVYKGTTDEYGLISFKPGQYGAYAVRENKVPDEYEISDGYITFTVKASGVEGETTFYNTKKDKPKLPEPGKKGFIDATYNNDANGYGNGWFDRDGNWHPFAGKDKTGDYFPFMTLSAMLALGLIGFTMSRRKKGEKHAQNTEK